MKIIKYIKFILIVILILPLIIPFKIFGKITDLTIKKRMEIFNYNMDILNMPPNEALKEAMKFDYLPPKVFYPLLLIVYLILLYVVNT